ncbi:hypothetical protein J3R82DRAFT_6001 [Butyriboletus roseoflavus]|nr:hypothetical protein J3R82DRAFT_6001 [Butyriboletus roseoflavus]
MCRALFRTVTPLSRSLHVSSASRHLVGPNDPISNFRPIVYTDTPTPAASYSQGQLEPHVNHPYSLNEFIDVPHDHTLELQYKLARERFDAFNHHFWTDVGRDSFRWILVFTHMLHQSNTRFETAKQSVLASLPESASPETHEAALSEFYKKWVMQEKARQDEYSAEWRKRNWNNILLAARVQYQRFKQRIL